MATATAQPSEKIQYLVGLSKAYSAEHVANILKVYDGATQEEREEGLNWYPTARTFAVGLSAILTSRDKVRPNFLRSVNDGAAIIAALSPQVSWERNMTMADHVVKKRRPAIGQTEAFNAKALAIVNRTAEQNPLDMLGKGPKTIAFAWNIAYAYEDSGHVTIDRHALHVALGRILAREERGKFLRPKGVYESIASAYVAASKERKVLPSVMQATCWVVWRDRIAPGLKSEYQGEHVVSS